MTGTGRAVFWSSMEAVSAAALSAVSAFVVARIVGPAELGAGAAAVALHVLLWVAVNALFADAMVQRASLSDGEASSAFWASVCAGALAGAVEAASGWGLAAALGDRRLIGMSAALACALPLAGAGGAAQGLLTRRRDYRSLAARTVAGQGAGVLAGVAAASLGAGAWALAAQQGVTTAAGAAALLVRAGFRPAPALRAADARALLRIGLPLTASTLVQHGRYRLFALLVGATAGPAVLGQVHMAFRLVDAARELASTALWRLMLPPMAEAQGDLAALQATADRFLRGYGAALFPACGAILACAAPATEVALGPVWAPAGGAAGPLALLAACGFLLLAGNVAAIARGRPGAFLTTHLAATALTLGGVAALRPSDPREAAWIWCAGQLLATPYAIAVAARVLHAGPLRQMRAGAPAFALAALATGAAFAASAVWRPEGAWAVAAVRLGAGGAGYLAGAWLLLRRRADAAGGQVRLLGLDYADMGPEEAAAWAAARPPGAPFAYVVTPNADHIARLRRLPALEAAYRGAALRLLDSRVVRGAARALGLPAPRVCTGSDLTSRILEAHLAPSDPVTVIGMTQTELARLGLLRAAHHVPRRGFEHDPIDLAEAARFAAEHPSRYVFIAVGSPRQEILAAAIAADGRAVGTGLCIGAALAFAARTQPRAPRWMQGAGIEWLHRLLRDPRRLGRRYLVDSPPVFLQLLRARVFDEGAS